MFPLRNTFWPPETAYEGRLVLRENTNCLSSILAKKFCNEKKKTRKGEKRSLFLFTSQPFPQTSPSVAFTYFSSHSHSVYLCLRSGLHLLSTPTDPSHIVYSLLSFFTPPLSSFIFFLTSFLSRASSASVSSLSVFLPADGPALSLSHSFHLQTVNRVLKFFRKKL